MYAVLSANTTETHGVGSPFVYLLLLLVNK